MTTMETTTYPSSEGFTRGRIRLNEHEAILLLDTLHREIDRMLDARDEMQEAGVNEGRALYDVKMGQARRVLAEIERTVREKGWTEAISVIESYGRLTD